MSERKVLNKYYPPDFDPAKIPKLNRPANRQFTIRIMAPFNMRCSTCGEYIYKGKKFNSRKETVENEDYLGLRIFRFYIKCPRCVAEIAFKTDPERTDYSLEDGATRNFEAAKTAEDQAKKELKEIEDEEKNNPMKVLENRTKASRQEMEMLESLEDLRDLNSRQAVVDHEKMINLHKAYEQQLRKLQEEEDEDFIRSVFGRKDDTSIKRIADDDEGKGPLPVKKSKVTPSKPTDMLTEETSSTGEAQSKPKKPAAWQKSIGGFSSTKSSLGMLVKTSAKKQSASSSIATSSSGTPRTDVGSGKEEQANTTKSTELNANMTKSTESNANMTKSTESKTNMTRSKELHSSLTTSTNESLNYPTNTIATVSNSNPITAQTNRTTSETASTDNQKEPPAAVSSSQSQGPSNSVHVSESKVDSTVSKCDSGSNSSSDSKSVDKKTVSSVVTGVVTSSGLGLLGSYSDTSSNDSDHITDSD